MHSYFTFSFLYPLIKKLDDPSRKTGFSYQHSGDIEVTGRGWKLNAGPGIKNGQFDFEIENTLVEGIDVYPQIEENNALHMIKAACLHHISQPSYSRSREFSLPYFPLKTAI